MSTIKLPICVRSPHRKRFRIVVPAEDIPDDVPEDVLELAARISSLNERWAPLATARATAPRQPGWRPQTPHSGYSVPPQVGLTAPHFAPTQERPPPAR